MSDDDFFERGETPFHDDSIIALSGGDNDDNKTVTIEGMTLCAKPHAFAGAVLSPKHARELTPTLSLAIASGLADQSYRKQAVPYTLWITEAWRVLGWGEPSAALFWEMATMYHTLYLAGRAYATDFHETQTNIPPILSCGSTSSMGSGNTHYTMGGGNNSDKNKKNVTSASAKELPVWLVATFLLMHCEEMAYQRNLSALDDRRLNANNLNLSDPLLNLLKYPGMSPRAHLNAGWHNDNSHCTAYLLRHLRKLLLLACVSHNSDAVRSIMHLAAIPSPPPGPVDGKFRKSYGPAHMRYSADDLRRQHDDEHGNVGLQVKMSMEDLERLNFWLQPPSGGGVDDSPLKIGEYLYSSLYSSNAPPTATIPIGDVEREVRRHLELELLMAGVDVDDKEDVSTDDEETTASLSFSQLSLTDSTSGDDGERAKQPQLGHQKEITYTSLRGTTIFLKPNTSPPSEVVPKGTASITSGDHHDARSHSSSSRLHDLAISECSDVHMYLLKPFENVTIAACHDCTFVVGAVAGLVHVVDCDRVRVTTAARRILLSNSCDTIMNVFTPTPPLLVGDNRSCQFAPYNTYYEGLREDLLSTGLAAAAVPAENPSPFHGPGRSLAVEDGPWPPVQCASNKWKYPIEISKLEIPQVGGASSSPPSGSPTNHSPGADDKVPGSTSNAGTIGDSSLPVPLVLPASEFHVLLVPLESESMKQRRLEAESSENHNDNDNNNSGKTTIDGAREGSKYCRVLAEVLQFSPFRMPIEYERRALVKADRMKSIQQAIRKSLPEEKQKQFEEELNRGFREWLVTSGNLRQVLDLVHLERRGGV